MQTQEITDEEGFTFKRRVPLTPTQVNGRHQTLSKNKGKGVARRDVIVISSPEYPSGALSPVSPYPPDHISILSSPSRRSVELYTLSPEYTGPQSPSLSLTPPLEESRMVVSKQPPFRDFRQFYTEINPSLQPAARMRQLLLWCVHQIASQPRAATDDDPSISYLQAVHNKVLNRLLNGDVDTSWYRRSGESKLSVSVPNQRNSRNRQKIRKYSQLQVALREEQDQWKAEESKMYERHAQTMDGCATEQQLAKPVRCEDYFDYLDDDQKAFLETYQATVLPAFNLRKLLMRTSVEITDTRQTLNHALYRQRDAGRLGEHLLGHLSKQLRNDMLCLPSTDSPRIQEIPDAPPSPVPPLTPSSSNLSSSSTAVASAPASKRSVPSTPLVPPLPKRHKHMPVYQSEADIPNSSQFAFAKLLANLPE
ncbi:hypothetical protein DM01DRAFT_1383255 [Hesseltinella vesiculosa]|uniref:Uncharacterized protein n=1 Tax=Hesseltinella vesiculosa TaxID=101127 RepID=A0A1X2GIP0_9FUNG|nr:hypothetical protein DM01DRAFT_1383255 [Hesseltinella vesiculosa]